MVQFKTILDDKQITRWVIDRTPYPQRKGFDAVPDYPMRGIGYAENEKIVAGFIFMNHSIWNKTIEVGVALEADGAILRPILRHAMIYPFIQLGCQRVTAFIPKRAIKSRKLVETIGFKEEGNIRLGFGTDHCIVYGLLKKEAEKKWKFSALQA